MKAPRVTLDQWRTLQAVVDHGGFAQAALALHRSQSSVSYTIARMQEQLGVPLLTIEGRRAVLTEAGSVLLRRSRSLVQQASQLELLAWNMEQGWESEVQLVVDAAYPTERLTSALLAFMPRSQGCRVQLREEVLSGVEERLTEGAADLAISGLSISGYLPRQLNSVEFVAVAAPSHPLLKLQRQLTHSDLEDHLQIVIRDSGQRQPRDTGWLGAEQRWTVASLYTAAKMVISGLGFSWLPTQEVNAHLRSGALCELPLEQGGRRSHNLFLYANKNKPLGPATQILAELLVEHSMRD
jgi:DNA-binding transcriptional LysR family regulator